MSDERRAVTAAGAPKALGPYSQAVTAGDLVFCSGQVGLDPATGRLIEGGVERETARVLAGARHRDRPAAVRRGRPIAALIRAVPQLEPAVRPC